MNLFIDIDGVLLGKSAQTNRPVLANHAKQFLQLALRNYDCYWLTTHCKGDAQTAVDYLMPYLDHDTAELVRQIKATDFKTFKVEALFGEFLWIDDQPTAYEIEYLDQHNKLACWIQVNTRKNINDLATIFSLLNG